MADYRSLFVLFFFFLWVKIDSEEEYTAKNSDLIVRNLQFIPRENRNRSAADRLLKLQFSFTRSMSVFLFISLLCYVCVFMLCVQHRG